MTQPKPTVEEVARELRRRAGGMLVDNELASLDGFKLLAAWALRFREEGVREALEQATTIADLASGDVLDPNGIASTIAHRISRLANRKGATQAEIVAAAKGEG